MYGAEERAYGDSGYAGASKRPEAIKKNKNGKRIKYIINRRPSSIKKLSKSGQYAAAAFIVPKYQIVRSGSVNK